MPTRHHDHPPHPGTIVTMGGKEWIVPPLTLGQLRRLMPKLGQLSEPSAIIGEAQIGSIVEIVTAALQRNYPELGEELVENLLDLGNAASVLSAVLAASGLKARSHPSGEAIAPGPGPGARSPTVAGATSMVFSQPPADTAIR